MGIGMVLVVRGADAGRAARLLRGAGQPSWLIGEIRKGRKGSARVLLQGEKG
jgi:phosphoribosylaminoimidazole (AIR) synthetase